MFKNLRLVYITTSDKKEAKKIGRALVNERLAACVNIIDGMESMYRWKGQVEEDNECILIAKTNLRHVSKLTNRVKELHSYECPCVITFTLNEQEGNGEYLDWLEQQVTPLREEPLDLRAERDIEEE